jgi:hypothetical protein
MDASDAQTTKGMIDYTKRLDEYKETVSRLFPALPRDYVDTRSISEVDALALGHFLECYPRKVIVLDIGTFVGVSAFHFAAQPNVLRVIGVDPNPKVVDEINDKSDMPGSSRIAPEPLQNLRVLDVARAVLAEFGDEQQKIQFHVGTVSDSGVGTQGASLHGLRKVETPVLEPSEGVSLVAFVNGLHTKEVVQTGLEYIFEKDPHTVAVLGDCRGPGGPFVQAGIVSFMEKAQEKYRFQLFGDLGPSIATSGLGIVYSDIDAAEAKQTLVEFSELFSERLDLLRLLRREEELINVISCYKNAANRHKKEADRLRKHNSQLTTQYSSRRYKLADTLSEGALRVPGVQKLVRSELMQKLVPTRSSGTPGS